MNNPIFWNYPELLPGVGFGNGLLYLLHMHIGMQRIVRNKNILMFTAMLSTAKYLNKELMEQSGINLQMYPHGMMH